MISIGDPIPKRHMMTMGRNGPEEFDTAAFFKNRRIAVFGLPGAYTPECSVSHLPGFVKRAEELVVGGCDAIACVSVNDPFVMDAWGREHGADGITMIADYNGDFTRAIGLSELRQLRTRRSKRYSMLVDGGVVTTLNVEASVLDHGVSSCSTLVQQL